MKKFIAMRLNSKAVGTNLIMNKIIINLKKLNLKYK